MNDIGERLGFGKAWPAAAPPTAGTTTTAAAPGGGAGPNAGGPTQTPPGANWGAPWESYRYGQPSGVNYPPYTPVGYGPPPPNVPPPAPVFDGQDYVPVDPGRAGFDGRLAPRNRFPAGAIWLIALGTIFLLNTSGVFHGFPFRALLPLFFLGLGGWTFVHKMMETGYGWSDDGSPAYRVRVFRAARGAVWLILVGVIFFLAEFDILPWSRSWPLFLILAGVMAFLERAVYSGVSGPAGYGYPTGASMPAGEQMSPTDVGASAPSQEGR